MTAWNDVRYKSADGLTLYARDYNTAGPDAPVILCLHGLTRNSSDFEDTAAYLAPKFRVIVAEQRGRGKSEWDPDMTHYQPPVYCADMVTLLDHLNIPEVILIGTSMGGIMSMILMAMIPNRIRAVILNDIGPILEQAGLDRIKGYVGKSPTLDSYEAAAGLIKDINLPAFPDYTDADWLKFARRTCTETADGIMLAYDPKIAEFIRATTEAAAPADMWALFDLLAAKPLLIVRGGLSDLLSAETVAEMCRHHGSAKSVIVPNRGHAPFLEEPEARTAIEAFLADIMANAG